MSLLASLSLTKHESKPSITNNINICPPTTTRVKLVPKVKTQQLEPVSIPRPPHTIDVLETIPSAPPAPTTDGDFEQKLDDYPTPPRVGFQPPPNAEPTLEETTAGRLQLFEKELLRILIAMFGSDKSLLKHMLEPTDKIILTEDCLSTLIAVLTGSDNVRVETAPFAGCCGRSSGKQQPIVRVEKITVNGADFYINYNESYNLFSLYNVRIDRCFA